MTRSTPRCPGCAYDLTGVIGAGATDLERAILCSECGRRLRVSEAMSAGIEFEQSPRARQWLTAGVVALTLLLGPLLLLILAHLLTT